jgi:hypothetical protein
MALMIFEHISRHSPSGPPQGIPIHFLHEEPCLYLVTVARGRGIDGEISLRGWEVFEILVLSRIILALKEGLWRL